MERNRSALLTEEGGGATLMPTADEYRSEAKAVLRLARQAREPSVRTALIELARDYHRFAWRAVRANQGTEQRAQKAAAPAGLAAYRIGEE